MRQRVRTRVSPLAFVGRALVALLALALVWYGLMLVLLALKVSPGSVNAISGYRSIYDSLAALGPGDVDGTARIVIAVAGVLAFLAFGYLALKEVPRPYLARSELELAGDDDQRGTSTVAPRAIERAAELAAEENPAVSGARARYEAPDIELDVSLGRAGDVAGALRDVQRRAVAALERHELPASDVNVTLAHFERTQRRDLQ
jgi:hypothetical protein